MSILWVQQNALAELIQLLIVFLLFVIPPVIKFFTDQAAKKQRQRFGETETQKQLHDAFESTTFVEEAAVPPKPKKERRKKKSELSEERPTHGTPLSRELGPQGEGSRFDAKPGTLDGSQILSPSVEPSVQPMLESMTGIYDAPIGQDQTLQTPLAVDIFRMLTTPGGVRQAVVLAEILKRPEY